ncbi:MAG: sensor domain-containing diguanylate cyclase [Shewanella sp.]
MVKVLSKQIKLRQLLLLLGIISVAITFANALFSVYQAQYESTFTDRTESNRVYAAKMAEITDVFIASSFSQLEYTAGVMSSKIDDLVEAQKEVKRLNTQTEFFNSAIIVNADGHVVATSRKLENFKGYNVKELIDGYSQQLSISKKPFVTAPFRSPSNHLIIAMLYPIVSEKNEYLGFIAGSIYLTEDNIFGSILGNHHYEDGSYFYVVDKNKTLIYHPKIERVGEAVSNNTAIDAINLGERGSQSIVNTENIKFVAGYAPVLHSGWGIVVQTPEKILNISIDKLFFSVLTSSLPISLIALLIIWYMSAAISKPLSQLSTAFKELEESSLQNIDLSKVNSWYCEASLLKHSFEIALSKISNRFEQLNIDALTDPMTGLLNRRGLDKNVANILAHNLSFSVLVLDIDFFKRVNDNFGHDMGDEVLKEVAKFIKKQARTVDSVSRTGGEEFVVCLLNTDIKKAILIAERIRKSIEVYEFDTVGHITISIGIAFWQETSESFSGVLKRADEALYKAKQHGRNRIELAATPTTES